MNIAKCTQQCHFYIFPYRGAGCVKFLCAQNIKNSFTFYEKSEEVVRGVVRGAKRAVGSAGGGGGGAKPLFCQKLIFFFSRWSPLKRGTIAWRNNRTFVSSGTPIEVATLIKGISHFFFFCIW